jgi:hypothetical protein
MQGKWISTHSRFARNSLLAPDPRAWADIPPGENCRVQTMEVELWSGPRRDALKTLCPTTHRSTGLRVHATARAWASLPLDTMRRMHTQHSGATPTGNTTLPAAWSTSSERSRLRTTRP